MVALATECVELTPPAKFGTAFTVVLTRSPVPKGGFSFIQSFIQNRKCSVLSYHSIFIHLAIITGLFFDHPRKNLKKLKTKNSRKTQIFGILEGEIVVNFEIKCFIFDFLEEKQIQAKPFKNSRKNSRENSRFRHLINPYLPKMWPKIMPG